LGDINRHAAAPACCFSECIIKVWQVSARLNAQDGIRSVQRFTQQQQHQHRWDDPMDNPRYMAPGLSAQLRHVHSSRKSFTQRLHRQATKAAGKFTCHCGDVHTTKDSLDRHQRRAHQPAPSGWV